MELCSGLLAHCRILMLHDKLQANKNAANVVCFKDTIITPHRRYLGKQRQTTEHLLSPFFCNMEPPMFVIDTRRLETAWWSHLQRHSVQCHWTLDPLR